MSLLHPPSCLKLQALNRRVLTFMDYSCSTEISQASQSYRNDITVLHLYGMFSLLINTTFFFFFSDCIICFIIWKTEKSKKEKYTRNLSAYLKIICVNMYFVNIHIIIYLGPYHRCLLLSYFFT